MNELLKMIEEVDPNDRDRLDEIDARVECFMYNVIPALMLSNGAESYWFSVGKITRPAKIVVPQYTRSRDALKSIRPEGWGIFKTEWSWDVEVKPYRNLWSVMMGILHLVDSGEQVVSHCLPTEELAELHAIIQAIEWERNHER